MPDSGFVQAQLQALPPSYGVKLKGKYAWVRCPSHGGGQENTPSLMVNLERKLTNRGSFEVGSARCHGCGKFYPGWDALAADLRLENGEQSELAETRNIFDEQRREVLFGEDTPPLPDLEYMQPWPKAKLWRGVDGRVLRAVKARVYPNEAQRKTQLYLPCWVNGEHVGGITANIRKEGKRNYFNTKGPWVKQSGLFCYDLTARRLQRRGWHTLVLVEGPRDALKSIQYGLPAMAILGSANWSEEKAELVMALGVKKIILAFDADEAGDKATKAVNASLKSEAIIRRFRFPDAETDPGNMPEEMAQRILRHVA